MKELPSFVAIENSQLNGQIFEIYLAMESLRKQNRFSSSHEHDVLLSFDSIIVYSRALSSGFLVLLAHPDANIFKLRALSNLLMKRLELALPAKEGGRPVNDKFLESFLKQCSQNPDIRTYVIFDEKRRIAFKGEQIATLHETFVAIQQLANNIGAALGNNIGAALGADLLSSLRINGPHDQYVFRSLGKEPPWVFGVFAANPHVDLVNLIARLHDEAIEALKRSPDATNNPGFAPPTTPLDGRVVEENKGGDQPLKRFPDVTNNPGPAPATTPLDGRVVKENRDGDQDRYYRGTKYR